MTEAFIYDHVRTPRGRGKADGGLHEITPIQLAAQTLGALRSRIDLDTALVDDIVFGCVAMIQMRRSTAPVTDRRLATAAIVVGIVSLVLSAASVSAVPVMPASFLYMRK